MTYRTTGTGVTVSLATVDNDTAVPFTLYEFLTQASPTGPGWTVAGSSDGTTGGMGSSVWTVIADADDADSWIVLESPDNSIQILLDKNGSNWDVRYNPSADYSGGSSSTIPTGTDFLIRDNASLWGGGSGNARFHISADDASPFNFFLVGTDEGDNATEAAFLFWSTTNDISTNPYPHLFFVGNDVIIFATIGRSTDGVFPSTVGVVPNGDVLNFSLMGYRDFSNTTYIPNGLPATSAGDIIVPGYVFRTDAPFVYHGLSNDLSYTSVNRTNADILGTNRLVWDDVIFPWTGSAPTSS